MQQFYKMGELCEILATNIYMAPCLTIPALCSTFSFFLKFLPAYDDFLNL